MQLVPVVLLAAILLILFTLPLRRLELAGFHHFNTLLHAPPFVEAQLSVQGHNQLFERKNTNPENA